MVLDFESAEWAVLSRGTVNTFELLYMVVLTFSL